MNAAVSNSLPFAVTPPIGDNLLLKQGFLLIADDNGTPFPLTEAVLAIVIQQLFEIFQLLSAEGAAVRQRIEPAD